jgi:carboxyl-terminal processing protease
MPSGPGGWPPQVPAAPSWPPQQQSTPAWPPQQPPAPPAWQPGSSWQQGQGWPPNQPPRTFDSLGAPAGDGMPRRPSRLPGILAVVAACLLAFSGGMVVDHTFFPTTTTATPGSTPGSTATSGTSVPSSALYQEALQIVKANFVGRASVTDQQLVYGAIKGMVDSLGDTGHSTFLTPAEYAAFQSSLNASVAGIGVVMSSANGVFRVDKVITGSPAAAGGVKAGDTITAVEGQSTTNMTMDDVSTAIRGTAGTKVTITVIHAGSTTPVDITMTRANVSVPLAEWGMIPGTHTADIVLAEFSTGAADQTQADITAATKAGATSIILDLRGNPGGYADEAQGVASEFLTSGNVYIQQDANGHNTDEPVDTSRQHTNLPLVVLVDHDSASSSEIVAGALQDPGRAKIVGVPTFGTGTVLQSFKLSDGSVIILGTSWWLTPNGHKIFGTGITPDQTVALAVGTIPLDPTTLPTMTVAQLSASGDAQLLAAVKDLNP